MANTLKEIEIYASNNHSRNSVKQFLRDTRWLVNGVYDVLKTQDVRCRFEKFGIILIPLEVAAKNDFPVHEFDEENKVCIRNYPIDLEKEYFGLNVSEKREKVTNIIYESLEDICTNIEMDFESAVDALNRVVSKN